MFKFGIFADLNDTYPSASLSVSITDNSPPFPTTVHVLSIQEVPQILRIYIYDFNIARNGYYDI